MYTLKENMLRFRTKNLTEQTLKIQPGAQQGTVLPAYKGVKYIGTFNDAASGVNLQVVKAVDLKCGVIELQVIQWNNFHRNGAKPINNKILYVYLKSDGRAKAPNDIETKRLNNLFDKATNPCDFDNLEDFGVMQNFDTTMG
jgi:hypothetical protein